MFFKLLRYLALTLISIIAIVTAMRAQSARPEKITLEDLLAVDPLGRAGPVAPWDAVRDDQK